MSTFSSCECDREYKKPRPTFPSAEATIVHPFTKRLARSKSISLEAELQASESTMHNQAAVRVDLAQLVFSSQVVRNLVVAQSNAGHRNRLIPDECPAVLRELVARSQVNFTQERHACGVLAQVVQVGSITVVDPILCLNVVAVDTKLRRHEQAEALSNIPVATRTELETDQVVRAVEVHERLV